MFRSKNKLSLFNTFSGSDSLSDDSVSIKADLHHSTMKGTFMKPKPKKENKTKQIIRRKLTQLIQYIKISEIVTCLLAVLSTVLAQFEQHEYYEHNREYRVAAMKVLNNLRYFEGKDVASYDLSPIVLNAINYSQTATFENIIVPLEISDRSTILRVMILISTVCAVIFLVISSGFKYIKDYKLFSRDESRTINSALLQNPHFLAVYFGVSYIDYHSFSWH